MDKPYPLYHYRITFLSRLNFPNESFFDFPDYFRKLSSWDLHSKVYEMADWQNAVKCLRRYYRDSKCCIVHILDVAYEQRPSVAAGIAKAFGMKVYADDPGYIAWWLFPAKITDEEIYEAISGDGFNPWGYHPCRDYTPTGEHFADGIWIRRTRTRALATQRGGLDV